METAIYAIKNKTMEHTPIGRVFLMAAMWVLNAGIWMHNFAWWLKIVYAVMAGIATLLGLINQWNSFYKTYKTIWIVFELNSLVTKYVIPKSRFKRKKKPHFTEKPPNT